MKKSQRADATKNTIKKEIFRNTIDNDVNVCANRCSHWVTSRAEYCIPRPLNSAIHGSKRNGVAHVDYLYMSLEGYAVLKYILLVRDGLSPFVWLCSTSSAIKDAAPDAFRISV